MPVIGQGIAPGRLGFGDRERNPADFQPFRSGEKRHVVGVANQRVGDAATVQDRVAQPCVLGCDGGRQATRPGPNDDNIQPPVSGIADDRFALRFGMHVARFLELDVPGDQTRKPDNLTGKLVGELACVYVYGEDTVKNDLIDPFAEDAELKSGGPARRASDAAAGVSATGC